MYHPLAGRTVLQFIPELEAGGAERTAVDMAEGLVHAGARPPVATQAGRLVGELQAKGGIWIPFLAAAKNPFAMPLNVRRLATHLLQRAGVDSPRPLAGPGLGGRWGGPLPRASLRDHLSRQLFRPLLDQVLYNSVTARGDAIIANSEYTR